METKAGRSIIDRKSKSYINEKEIIEDTSEQEIIFTSPRVVWLHSQRALFMKIKMIFECRNYVQHLASAPTSELRSGKARTGKLSFESARVVHALLIFILVRNPSIWRGRINFCSEISKTTSGADGGGSESWFVDLLFLQSPRMDSVQVDLVKSTKNIDHRRQRLPSTTTISKGRSLLLRSSLHEQRLPKQMFIHKIIMPEWMKNVDFKGGKTSQIEHWIDSVKYQSG
jgi:hypothetical protein